MLVTGIKSKPVYTALAPDLSGRYHLMVGHGVGSEPLLRVLRDLRTAAPESGARTRVLFVGSEADAFHAAGAAEVSLFAHEEELLGRLREVLDTSVMGTRLYVAGPESFMGLVMRIAR